MPRLCWDGRDTSTLPSVHRISFGDLDAGYPVEWSDNSVRLDWFPFYVIDWRLDPHVQAMTYEERGVYLELLFWQWTEGDISSDVVQLARLLRLPVGVFEKNIWENIRDRFEETGNGRCVNPKLAEIRKEQDKKTDNYRRAGIEGARKRWQQDNDAIASPKKPHSDEMALKSKSKKKSKSKEDKSTPIPEDFEEFWGVFPRKVGKLDALKAWHQTEADRPPLEELIGKLKRIMRSDAWQDPQYRPYPATWLRRGSWTDEPQKT